jgi:Tfp pilus assembly protein FimV
MFGTTLDSEHAFVHPETMHRTYVRRRLTSFAAAVVVASALGAGIAGAASSEGAGTDADADTYVVRQGDTLWTIAHEVAPERDPREVVHELSASNPGSDVLVPGAVLTIPPA